MAKDYRDIEGILSALNSENPWTKAFKKYFGINDNVIELVRGQTFESLKALFETEKNARKISDTGMKVLLTLAFMRIMSSRAKFLGPEKKFWPVRIANGDMELFYGLCFEAANRALFGASEHGRGGTGFDYTRSKSMQALIGGWQYYFGGYLDMMCRSENGKISELNTDEVHPDAVDEEEGKRAGFGWDKIASQVSNNMYSVDDEDYEIFEKLKSMGKDFDKLNSEYPLRQIAADIFAGESLMNIASKYNIGGNIVRYKIAGKDGVLLDQLQKHDIDMEDLAKAMKRSPDLISKALAS